MLAYIKQHSLGNPCINLKGQNSLSLLYESNEYKNSLKLNCITNALIPGLDFIGRGYIEGPNGGSIQIESLPLNLGHLEALGEPPYLLMPLGGAQESALQSKKRVESMLPVSYPLCIKEGFRRTTALALIRLTGLGTTNLKDFNTCFCKPPKSEEALEDEVLSRQDELLAHLSERIKMATPAFELDLRDWAFNKDTHKYYKWDKKENI